LEARPRDVPPRPRQAGDEPLANRIDEGRKDDGDRPAGLLGRPDCWLTLGQDEVDLEVDQFGCQRGQALHLPFRKAVLQGNILAFYIPKVAEPLAEGREGGMWVKGVRQNPDTWHLRHRLCVREVWRQPEAEGQGDKELKDAALHGGVPHKTRVLTAGEQRCSPPR
jgi:hypothetical protein